MFLVCGGHSLCQSWHGDISMDLGTVLVTFLFFQLSVICLLYYTETLRMSSIKYDVVAAVFLTVCNTKKSECIAGCCHLVNSTQAVILNCPIFTEFLAVFCRLDIGHIQ